MKQLWIETRKQGYEVIELLQIEMRRCKLEKSK